MPRGSGNVFRAEWRHWPGFERRGRLERFGAAQLPFDRHARRGEAAPRRVVNASPAHGR
jgi:hypothetical protein